MKKIKFPLEMKDGHLVKELEELQEFFDLKKAIEYFANGKLQKWLENNYDDDILEELEELTGEEEDFIGRFTETLGVQVEKKQIKVQEVFREAGIKERLKRVLPEEAAEEAAGLTATNQAELENLVKRGIRKIYLLSGPFLLKKDMEELELIGIERPVIKTEEKETGRFYRQKIHLSGKFEIDETTNRIIYTDLEDEMMLEFLDMLELYLEKMLEEKPC